MVGLHPDYKPHPVTDMDREISLICWGFTLGFGFLTGWKAWKQTMRVNRDCRIKSVYVWLLWADIVGSFGFGIGAWFYMQQHVRHGFPLFFIIVFSWAIQIQSQLQIIINRLRIIMPDKHRAAQLRWTVFGIILVVNIMVGSIWIPTAMQVDPIYLKINNIWDRIQKIIYLVVDGSLNFYFVRLVNQQLVNLGLEKYKPLATFNTRIVILSVAMDCMIIGMMFYPNPYVFMAFHPPAFLVKVNIEMSMADLILKIAKTKEFTSSSLTQSAYELNHYSSTTEHSDRDNYGIGRLNSSNQTPDVENGNSKFSVVRTQEVRVEAESQTSFDATGDQNIGFENDEQPLHGTRMGIYTTEITSSGHGRAL